MVLAVHTGTKVTFVYLSVNPFNSSKWWITQGFDHSAEAHGLGRSLRRDFMATEVGDERPTLFLRKATGLVRGWSVRDSMIYACLSTNVITLGLVEFAYQDAFPAGQLLTAVLISAVWVSFLVLAYSGLVVTIPRAGGDYVWQSRILGSGIGFVMAATGWWFILWLWAPIYGSVLSEEFFQPLWVSFNDPSGAAWFGTHTGTFVVTLITIGLAACWSRSACPATPRCRSGVSTAACSASRSS